MSEIRDMVREQIVELLISIKGDISLEDAEDEWEDIIARKIYLKGYVDMWLNRADQILSICIDDRYELAVVDRKAELPSLEIITRDKSITQFLEKNHEVIKVIASMMGTAMLEQDWVKEVKDV